MRTAPDTFDPRRLQRVLDTDETHDIEVSYKANDGTVDSTIGTVSFTVTGANDAAQLSADTRN